jgi:hypothetical protein
MSTVLRRLVTVLGFRINKTGIGDYEKSINSLKKNVNQLNLSFNSLKFATRGIFFGNVVLSGVALGVAKTANSLDELSKKTGLTSGKIQALELVSQKFGNSYGEITKTMAGFADKVSKIKDPLLRLNTLQSLMIDKNKKLANVFKQSSDSFKKSMLEASNLTNIFTPKNIADSKEYIKNWAEFRTILDNIRTTIGLSYMPVFNKLTISFKNWYLQNKELIGNLSNILTNVLGKGLMLLGDIFGSVLKPIGSLINYVSKLEKEFGFLQQTMSGVGVIFSYVLPLFLPISRTFKLITVGVIALNDVFEDLIGWTKGIDSVFGLVFGKFEKWQGVLDSFSKSVLSVTNQTMTLFKGLSNINFKFPSFNQNNDKDSNSKLSSNLVSKNSFFKPNKESLNTQFLNQKELSKQSFFNPNREFFTPEPFKPDFISSNFNKNTTKSQNINLSPNFSIKIDNVSVGDNVTADQARSTALNISELIKKELELNFSDLVNNLSI